jgi:transposase
MIALSPNVRVWLACGRTDMRRGFDGLSSQVQQQLSHDPFICVERYYVAASLLDACF